MFEMLAARVIKKYNDYVLRQRRGSSLMANCIRLYGIKSVQQYEADQNAKFTVDSEKIDPFDYTIFGNKRKLKVDIFHYTDRRAGRGYCDYSTTVYPHRPFIWPPLRKFLHFNMYIAGVCFLVAFLDHDWVKEKAKDVWKFFRTEAASLDGDEIRFMECKHQRESEDTNVVDSCELDKEKRKKKLKRKGFRERKIIEYENRLRLYSSPEKIFRYFATIKVVNEEGATRPYEIFMTPEDFVRSFTPGGMQPNNFGLDRYRVFERNQLNFSFAEDGSVFAKITTHGLISYSEYLFLMSLLSTSSKDVELAFKIFDMDGDGELNKDEFERFQELVMMQTSVGQLHRYRNALSMHAKVQNSGFKMYFFGKDGRDKLSASAFLLLQAHLHLDILKIECRRRDMEYMESGRISDVSFAKLLLVYSGLSEVRQRKMLKRVKNKFGSKSSERTGVTLDEINKFFRFLYFIDEIDLALHFYSMVGASIDAELLKKVALKVTKCDISDHVLNIVITLFDENQDGQLSAKEFVSIMKKRMGRGLEQPKDTHVVKLLNAISHCAAEQFRETILFLVRSY